MQPSSLPSQQKWGEAARGGFQVVPDVLLKNQHVLNIGPTELVVLLNVLMHWWYKDQKPFPRPTTIARRMGITVRTVQRALARLEEAELVVRQKGPNDSTFLDPSPLVERLSQLVKTDRDYLIRVDG
jgi:DNA-binding MarR family transcriptional regulator